MNVKTGRGIKRTGKSGSIYLLAEIMRSDAFMRINGSANSKSHEEECHHGNVENWAGYHCRAISFLLSSKDSGFGSKSETEAGRFQTAAEFARSLYHFFPGRVLMLGQCVYLRSSKCRGVSEARAKKSIGVT